MTYVAPHSDRASDPVRTIALCAGLLGLERAVDRCLRTELVGVVERQAYCAAVIAARMQDASVADAPLWDDLSTFDGRHFRDRVDLVTAGFPCQSVSVAGRQRGITDERWLWPHVIRVVDECGAPLLFVENVPGLLSASNGEAFAEVLGNLAARGWIAEWDCFPAASAGAVHLRDRFFMLAADPNRIELRQLAERHQRQGRRIRTSERRDIEPDDDGANRSAGLDWWANVVGRSAPIATLDRMDDGYAGRLGDPVTAWWDQTHAIGNAVVEQSAAYAFSNLLVRLSDVS